MSEKVEVKVTRKTLIEQIEGGLFFVSDMQEDGTMGPRVAATSGASLFKHLTAKFSLQKGKRGPRKAKETPAPAGKTSGK